jgi:hypothetical protein
MTLLTSPTTLQRLEGAAVLALAVTLYTLWGSSWWLFALLLFSFDLSMLGYLRGPRAGAAVYNLVHSYALPALAAGLGLLFDTPLAVAIALIWFAHIGLDRALGYGLKLPGGFQETHLGRIGRAR